VEGLRIPAWSGVVFIYYSVPLCIGLFLLSRFSLHIPLTALTIMQAWLLAAIASVWWAGEYGCPRCRRRYAALGQRNQSSNLMRGLFDKICSNCKLRKFEHAK